MLLLIRLLHPHTQRRRHQRLFLDNSESINMKQTNRNRNIWNTSKLQQGHLPWHKLPTQHENSVASNISYSKILVCIFYSFYQFLLVAYNLYAGLPCLFLLHCCDISSVTQRRGHPLHLYWHIRSLTTTITFLSLLMDKKRITWKLIRKLNKNPYIYL